ncbi:MAG TPA: tetratricopeptide repeat protein [Dissulfurispiraceae bacterium]|nr:tetratricopeptide repeat protein [Dissulfurispiraceae bacterium]
MQTSFTAKAPWHRRLLGTGAHSALVLFMVLLTGIAADISSAADSSKDSVVVITVRDADGVLAASSSGTVLRSDGLVATTCTIVTQWLLGARHTLRIVTSDGTDMPMIDTLFCDKKTNSALIRIPAEGLSPVIAFKQKDMPKSAVLLSRISPREVKRTTLALTPRKIKTETIASSTFISEALAGGPVLNERGAALGIATVDRISRTTLVVPLSRLFDHYEQYRRLQKKRRQIELLEQTGSADRSSIRPVPPEVMQAQNQVNAQPGNPEAYMSLGKAYDASRLYGQAVDAYRHAIRLDPGKFDGHINLGLAAYRAGRYREAVNAYESALRLQSQSVATLIKLGAAYLILGEYSYAVSALKKAAAIEPKNPQTRYNLGIAHFLNGDDNAAMVEYLHLNVIDPERARSLFDLVN